MVAGTDIAASLLDAELVLTRRQEPDPDEDAVTLAAEAALRLLGRTPATADALIFATIEPPYDEGGSVQPLAELTGLSGSVLALELTSSLRDGLTAIRVAAALLAAGHAGALVCASSRTGAIAVLLAHAGGSARLVALGARTEELRDRWRLAATASVREADASFVWDAGARAAAALADGAAAIVTADARASDRAERACGGPGDPLPSHLGAAHAPARLVLGLEEAQTVVAAGGGLSESMRAEPGMGAAAVAARARAELVRERDDEPPPGIDWEEIAPYVSAPRSWRERGQDLRLEGARCASCARLAFPAPPRCPGCGSADLAPERLARTGVVLTHTRDHAYPAAKTTGMAVVDLDGGGRFYGQVVPSGSVAAGQRVRLVPRRLHIGGGAVQYFWKVTDADLG